MICVKISANYVLQGRLEEGIMTYLKCDDSILLERINSSANPLEVDRSH
jgi:hypothetical protein